MYSKNSKKKYAILQPNLIKLFGAFNGHCDEFDDQICQLLAEDATFRLNEILNQSENLKRRLNKERLDVKEINLMLKCSNVKPIEGLESSDKDRIRSALSDEKNDELINLIDESNRLLSQKQFVRLKSIKLNSEYVQLKYADTTNCRIEQTDLNEELKKYYDFLIKNLFTSNDRLFEKMLKDLATNDQLNELVYYLIRYFLRNLVSTIAKDQNKLIKLILIIESLIKNKHLEFKLQSCFIQLIDLTLDCLLSDLDLDLDFLFKFRFYSAKLLGSILFKFHYVISEPLIKILNLLLNQFIDTIHLDIKYGIMIFFQNLNSFIFFEILFSHLMQFVQQLEIKLHNKTIEPEEKKLFGLILICLSNCFNYVINSKRIRNSTEFDVNQYYLKIYNVYGDSFGDLIASNDSNFIKIIKKES